MNNIGHVRELSNIIKNHCQDLLYHRTSVLIPKKYLIICTCSVLTGELCLILCTENEQEIIDY